MGAKGGKVYLIKAGIVQDIFGTFEKKGYIRGNGTATIIQGTDCLKIIHNSGQTVSETSTLRIYPNGKQKIKFTANLEDVMSGSGTYTYVAESVTTATTIANAYTNYKSKTVTGTTLTEYEISLSDYQESGFYFSVCMDTWASKYRTLKLYDVWME